MLSILDIAVAWGARHSPEGGISGSEFVRLGLPIMGGCQVCGATISAYNAHPGLNGFLVGSCCASRDMIYQTVESFEADYPRPIDSHAPILGN